MERLIQVGTTLCHSFAVYTAQYHVVAFLLQLSRNYFPQLLVLCLCAARWMTCLLIMSNNAFASEAHIVIIKLWLVRLD